MPTPLESLRLKLALPVGENAAFDGWNVKAVEAAAAQTGIDPAQARLAFPKAQAEMVDAYIQGVDATMEAEFTPEKIAAMKVRDRIRSLIWYRLEMMAPAREAVRTGLSILAMPQNLPLALGERVFPDNWTGLIALAVCSQLIGQGLLVYALGHVPPLVVGVAMLTQPALSALLGWIYYGETLSPRDLLGAAMIVVALILVRLKPKGEPGLHEPVAAPN